MKHCSGELTCEEQGDIVSVVAEGEILQADCPGLCPFLVDSVDIYGTGIYAGVSVGLMMFE